MSGSLTWWIIGIAGLAVAVAAFFIIRHQLYLKELRKRGWDWNSRPQLSDFLHLQVPPFGLGLNRDVDDLVSGTTAAGQHFDSFEYTHQAAGSFRERLLTVTLAAPLPAAFAFSTEPRPGLELGSPELFAVDGAGLKVVAGSAEYAQDVLAALAPVAAALPEPIDVSIDGDRLVVIPAPRDPEQLAELIESAAGVAQACGALQARWAVPAPVPSYAFYGHPDWSYIGTDDAVLDIYPVTWGGFAHRSEDVVRGESDGIRMDAFTHHWKTTETRVVSDGQGGTRTETYTESHVEVVCGFVLAYDLPALSVNGHRLGDKVMFESTDFNRAFTVRAENPKWASDVIHPRTMEWLLATRPAGWTMNGRVVSFENASHDLYAVDQAQSALRGFLGRIPRFVWDDLGLPVPPFLVE